MESVSPVFTEHEVEAERVVALDQPQYVPIIVLRVQYGDGSLGTVTRYRLSDKERQLVAGGADILISQPHHGPLMPIGLQLAMRDSYPVAEE